MSPGGRVDRWDSNGNYSSGYVGPNGRVDMYDQNAHHSYGHVDPYTGGVQMYDSNGKPIY